ncbi:MAG: type VI secretion system baseplate subunit TssE [Acidisphaera sp.]|nr:type VI secretion system baseplate subunit TssE [Acidisphaera sp.]
MSGRTGREQRASAAPRVQLPLLDRLIDDAPDEPRDPPLSAAEAMGLLRRAVRRDLEALLNARRRWNSWDPGLAELRSSPVGFGMPDFTSGAFNDKGQRDRLCAEIEETIRRFEPRFVSVRVSLTEENQDQLDPTLRLRIQALLHAEPAPEPVAFDTVVDPTTSDIVVRQHDT